MRASSSRPLGIWACLSLVVGTAIGSGIFLLPVSLAPYGSLAAIGWLFTSAGSLLIAFVFYRLASEMPRRGGPYAYSRASFGDFAGFWVAWGHWISLWTAVAGIAVALVSHLHVFIPALKGSAILSAIAAIVTVWALTFVNTLGVALSGRLQIVLTVVKLVPLAAMALAGLFFAGTMQPVVHASVPFSFSSIAAMAALMLWAFIGLESATVPAADVAMPRRTIPVATMAGVILISAIYLFGTWGVMTVLPSAQLSTSSAPFADAARILWGEWAYYAMATGAVLSCLSSMNGTILVQGQVAASAADDGLFPGVFKPRANGSVTIAHIIPALLVTLLLSAKYSSGAALIQIFEFTVLLATLSTLVPYAFCAAAVLVRPKTGSDIVISRHPLTVAAAVLAFIFVIFAILGAGAETVMYGFVLLLVGVPVYALGLQGIPEEVV